MRTISGRPTIPTMGGTHQIDGAFFAARRGREDSGVLDRSLSPTAVRVRLLYTLSESS
jgi:hypothetical protein